MIKVSEIGVIHHMEDIINIGLSIKPKPDGFTLKEIFSDEQF